MAKGAKKGANLFVWLILGLLVLALAGFGVDGFGTAMRTVGKVGDREISADTYATALQTEVRNATRQFGEPITMEQALAFGLDRQVRERLVVEAAFDHETARIGLSVGDERVQREILQIQAFRGLDGDFDRETYRATLRNNGLTETRFETRLREELARTVLQGAVFGGVAAPEVYVETLVTYLAERRSFTYLALGRNDLQEPLSEPGDADLRAFHEQNPERFTRPESREITFAWVTPEALLHSVAVDEALVQARFEDRADEFNLPERRLVERLVYGTQDEAEAAMARIGPEGDGFEDIVAGRGFTLSEIDIGDVSEAELGAAGAEVFAAGVPAVIGPLPSPFGPAIYRVNDILEARTTPLDQVRDVIVSELARDRARRVIADLRDPVDDMLAGGASLEEVAAETELTLGTIRFHDGVDEGIAAYPNFRRMARLIDEGDFPEVVGLDDGGIMALRLDAIHPPEVRPFEEVQVAVVLAWAEAEVERRLREQAEDIVASLAAGGSLSDEGRQVEAIGPLTRDGFVEGVSRAAVEAVFALSEGESRVVAGGGGVAIVRLDAVLPPDTDDPEVASLRREIADALSQGIAQDAFAFFSTALQRRAGISFNTTAVEAVHTHLSGGRASRHDM